MLVDRSPFDSSSFFSHCFLVVGSFYRVLDRAYRSYAAERTASVSCVRFSGSKARG